MPDPLHDASPAPDPPLRPGVVLAEEFVAVHGPTRIFLPPPGPDSPGPEQPTEAIMQRAFFDANTSALCLSGGGIRSASFCLGVVQGLARVRVLSRFHFLSTVSGGGYLGSLLAAWAYRTPGGYADVENELASPTGGPALPVAWWREYLSYLAPRRGLMSLDTWTLMATYVRNLLLNALIWLPVLAIVLLLPYLFTALVDAVAVGLRGSPRLDQIAGGAMNVGLACMILATVLLHATAGGRDPMRPVPGLSPRLQQTVQLRSEDVWNFLISSTAVQVVLFVGAVALAAGSWWLNSAHPALYWREILAAPYSPLRAMGISERSSLLVLLTTLYAFLSAFAAVIYQPLAERGVSYYVAAVLGGFACGAMSGFLISLIITWFAPAGPLANMPGGLLPLAATLVVPALVTAVALGEIIFVGATSKWSNDFDREWWSRAGARAARVVVAWLALFALALYGPALMRSLPALEQGDWPYWTVVTAASGIVARIVLVTGRTAPSEEHPSPQPRKLDRLLDAIALLLLLLLLIGIADLVDSAIRWVAAFTAVHAPQLEHSALSYAFTDTVIVGWIFAVILLLAGLGVNINRFSLHAMYRDRLIRAFLGATRRAYPSPPWTPENHRLREARQFVAREADPFIQFDRDDNPILRWLRNERDGTPFDPRKCPFLVVNAALNLVSGTNLAWQERKATSFTFSALHTGSATAGLGYRSSAEYAADVGGITLGTAMAVSGAAVSPNAGAFSSPVRTFLLTLFNARLGWWLGHPRAERAVKMSGPRFAIWPMVRELLGLTDDRPPWLFVSDGGHFDNLGLYEAVRRGCRTIIVVDASCDPFRNYDDLGNAIRKIRIDLGVTIERLGPWNLGMRNLQQQGRYCALFDVLYPGGNAANPGKLLYIKASLYEKAAGLPIDVVQYAGRSERFPHETTADQFFSESQFESYRALGEFQVAEIAGRRPLAGVEDLIDLAFVHVNKV
ncbi:MAG TPA: hypothetical protein VMV45_20185 [Casimicrobiaceae bacterium]|nr:hypothetical protein [Casimicrobiaceae bacterium]